MEHTRLNDRDEARQAIEGIAARVAADQGLNVLEVQIAGHPGAQHVRIFLDKDGGVGILDLQHASEELSALLDVENPIAGRFTLEVSSPGMDRPLTTAADFARVRGRAVHVQLKEPSAGRSEWTGTVLEATPEMLTLALEGRLVSVPPSHVARARLELPLPRQPKRKHDRRARRAHG